MIKNYLKIAWRTLMKNKGYFLINVIGLSTALTVSFLMLLSILLFPLTSLKLLYQYR